MAELEAIRIGLEVAWNEGFKDVICEVDALSVIHILVHPILLQILYLGWSVIVGCCLLVTGDAQLPILFVKGMFVHICSAREVFSVLMVLRCFVSVLIGWLLLWLEICLE